MRKKSLCICLAVLLLILPLGCKKAPAAQSLAAPAATAAPATKAPAATAAPATAEPVALADGAYRIEITLTGGTGKAKIQSPLPLTVQDGQMLVTIVWSSANYDYMLVDGVRYDAVIEEGHSVYTVPVASLEEPFLVVADTVAMSTPHEIEYTITFDLSTLQADKA